MTLPSDERSLIVSFHDLAPHSRELCQTFLDRLRPMGVKEVSLLVTPDWYGKENLAEHPSFITWLKALQAQGHEIVLHGLTHTVDRVRGGLIAQCVGRCYTAREGEFYQLDYEKAKRRMTLGMDIFRQAGLSSAGFVAPAWLLSEGSRRAAQELGFAYTTYWGRLELLQEDKIFAAPVIAFSSRSGWRRLASRLWHFYWFRKNRDAAILRLAVHPSDLIYPAIESTIYETVRRALTARRPITYGGLINR
ncbi:MAG: polysaccharide deacetylase family protein [Candidatus Omnitrophota bacterium]